MAVYNMSFMNNATNIVDLITGTGTAMGNQFLMGYLILFSFFIIFLVLAMKYDFNSVLMIGSFLTTILTILFYIAGLVPVMTIVYPAVMFFIVIIFHFFNNR